jgi:hypothetical protein
MALSSLSSLQKNGYILFPQLLTNYHLNVFENSIVSNKLVDYNKLKNFIDYYLLQELNKIFNWNAVYIKFRFSSRTNSNLKDASNFHGDLYNFTHNKTIPVFTALCNLDSSSLQLIPSSHIKHIKNNPSHNLNHVKTIHIHPGDVLIFHSNLFHRGIPNDNNRRLLQVFDIFPNQHLLKQNLHKIISIQTNQLLSMNFINKITQFTIQSSYFTNNTSIGLFDKLHYYLLYHHLQYKIIGIDIPHQYKSGFIIGYLPGKKDIIRNHPQPWNINIIVIPHTMLLPDTTLQTSFLFIFFPFFLFFILFTLIVLKKFPQ